MSDYKKPGTEVEVIANPRIVNLGEAVRIPAIIGSGPVSIPRYDVAMYRSTGSIDYLPEYPNSSVTVSKIANVPKIPSSFTLSISENGNLFSMASASVGVSGSITWTGSGVNVPTAGTVYYITYTVAPPASNFLPNAYSDASDITKFFGAENTTTGILSIAGKIALENGAPGVILCQASTSDVTGYKNAIDKLLKKTNIEDVIVVFPTTWTSVDRNSVINYAVSHLFRSESIDRERGLIFGSFSDSYATGGFDTIGDASTPNTYLYTSASLINKNIQYVVPSICTRSINNVNVTLDGNYIAAALAGRRSSRKKRSIPLHGANLTGITIEDEKWSEFEMNQLGAGNCTVLESRNGIITIRDHITTDPTSADTQEPSVVDIERLVKRSLRNGLNLAFTNKGTVITDDTTSLVETKCRTILQSLKNDKEIRAYGEVDNPITGETKTVAVRDITEPRRINVTTSYSALYPLKWIKVTTYVYV